MTALQVVAVLALLAVVALLFTADWVSSSRQWRREAAEDRATITSFSAWVNEKRAET